MIQRIQTLFLLVIFAVAVCLVFLPFQAVQLDKGSFLLCLMPGCSSDIVSPAIYAPMALDALVILLSLLTVFRYKNRRQQIKLSNFLVLLNVFIIGLFFLLSFVKEGQKVVEAHYAIGAFLPVLSILCAFLASFYIRKDEKLIRSADRIR